MTPIRATRMQADIEVEVLLPSGDVKALGRVRNLNQDGLLVEYTNPLQVGESVGVEFPETAERGRMVVLGEVAWAEQDRAGVRVRGMVPHHRARFEKLLTLLQGGQTLLG